MEDRKSSAVSYIITRYGIGSFREEEEAARAYDAAALRYFGEFASLNFGKDK